MEAWISPASIDSALWAALISSLAVLIGRERSRVLTLIPQLWCAVSCRRFVVLLATCIACDVILAELLITGMGLTITNRDLDLVRENCCSALSIVIPIAGSVFIEELLYRGLLFRFIRQHMPFLPAAVMVSMLFALAHSVSLSHALLSFCGSIVYCFAYDRSGGLAVAAFAHTFFNIAIFGAGA